MRSIWSVADDCLAESSVACYVLTGPTDFLLRIATADVDAYERFVLDRLSKLPGGQDIHSIVALSEIKPATGLPV